MERICEGAQTKQATVTESVEEYRAVFALATQNLGRIVQVSHAPPSPPSLLADACHQSVSKYLRGEEEGDAGGAQAGGAAAAGPGGGGGGGGAPRGPPGGGGGPSAPRGNPPRPPRPPSEDEFDEFDDDVGFGECERGLQSARLSSRLASDARRGRARRRCGTGAESAAGTAGSP
jgi:hypothetical protein